MKRGSLRELAFILAVAAPVASSAADFRPMIKAGVDFGGDDLVTAQFADGTTETIQGNQGFFFGGGVSVTHFHHRDLELEVSLTYKYTTAYGTNSKVSWTRFPLDAIVFYRWSRWRAGGGITYHLDPELKGTAEVSGLSTKFDNALGFLVQADYRITDWFTAGIRFTSIEYEASSGGMTAKGGGFGVTLGMSF